MRKSIFEMNEEELQEARNPAPSPGSYRGQSPGRNPKAGRYKTLRTESNLLRTDFVQFERVAGNISDMAQEGTPEAQDAAIKGIQKLRGDIKDIYVRMKKIQEILKKGGK